ncbi:hypothetical protein ACTFIR_008519 [Dictyostelium discoideum]
MFRKVVIILTGFVKCQNSCPYSKSSINGASATFYSAMDNGNCGYGLLTGQTGPRNYLICALGTKLYQNGAQCVMTTDSCNDAGYCQRDNHFDLSPNAFSILGLKSKGVLDGL